MRRLSVLFLVLAACGDNFTDDPFANLPQEGDLSAPGMFATVHVARDKFGVAHIRARSTGDAGYAQGYIMAHDRLPQMDILRRFGAGTLSEIFGALDSSVIDTDLEMRVHRMRPLAQGSWDALSASTDPTDQEIVQLLQRFADGVNAYAHDLQAKKWDLDPDVLVSFDPERFAPWTPVDSLVLGRFQAFALSWSSPFETDATEMYQKIRDTYEDASPADAAKFARKGIAKDLMKFTPVGEVPTIDGFPNVIDDHGTRADAGRLKRATAAVDQVRRPTVPQELFDGARSFFRHTIFSGPFGSLGPHAFMQPFSGSNNWAVGPSRANGQALLATDQHLQLPNPSIFYPTHLTIGEPGEEPTLDVMGVTFPGIPGVILGTNGKVAWSGTVSEHDVNDIYLETIAPCIGGTGDCVEFQGGQVALEPFTEDIGVGALGTITRHVSATYEVVPHHGPLIPTVKDHALVPRSGDHALSVRYTGYISTFEIRALWNLSHARTVDEGFAALRDFSYGSQNWTMIDVDKNIGWTTNAVIPNRDVRAYTWNVTSNPDGLAPFFVLPGDGTAEWESRMDSRYVPHAINPAQGYLATANADPVGATFDGDPLNQPMVAGRPLYAGITYAAGVRQERISQMIEAAGTTATLADMAVIQRDTRSNVGEHLVPAITAALGKLDDASATPSDVASYLASLSTEDRTRLQTARTLLAGWSRATPAAIGTPTAAELGDSAATALFNAWMHFFIERSLGDEFTAMSFDVWRMDDNQVLRIINAMLVHPATFVQSVTSHQPILCDDLTTSGVDESCSRIILAALVDAMGQLEGPAGFDTADVTRWQWGLMHHLTISPLFPNPNLDLPAPGESSTGGFPKAGDNFAVNRADQGWADLDFSQSADGPAQRFLAETTADGAIAVKWALPGGVIYDKRSAHYRDLLDQYYLPETHFDAPFTLDQIIAAGETRWTFH
ncbi:MAG: penicillin acylase family protein [Proteobacteria bacterium]|nr:penicillin acylase family protein [Pseudomonadota bacterium]